MGKLLKKFPSGSGERLFATAAMGKYGVPPPCFMSQALLEWPKDINIPRPFVTAVPAMNCFEVKFAVAYLNYYFYYYYYY